MLEKLPFAEKLTLGGLIVSVNGFELKPKQQQLFFTFASTELSTEKHINSLCYKTC
jgi:hypothetical protein